ncbi:MAG: O-methyltransferase [Bacteroidota bacterium]|nr:O-methyltransferase [Bacteroidota bacterium]
MEFLPKELDEYICQHSQKESPLLRELNRETWAKVLMPRMLSGHLQGRALSMLSKMISPKYVLEIGTFTGYSAICLCEGIKHGGKLITIDINEELENMANSYFKKAGVKDKIQHHIGNAIDIIPKLGYDFDLVFIDADKENYSEYFDLVIDKMPIGGFIVADNVLWSGKVIKDNDSKDQETIAIKEFNHKVQNEERVENVLFPIRDGLMICRKVK